MSRLNSIQRVVESLRQSLPVAWPRTHTPRLTGGLYSAQTLANFDSQKKGPPHTKMGKRVIYERESFLQWLEEKMQPSGGEVA